ncbi:MAG: hypothetical protein AAFR54_02290 [Planctomycetota bacterium]
MRSIFLAALLVPAPALGQEVLLRLGDSLPGGAALGPVTWLESVRVAPSGAYAVSGRADGDDVSFFWGSFDGGPGTLLRSEATIGALTQLSFDVRFGMNAAQLAYSARSMDGAGGPLRAGIWVDDAAVLQEDEPAPGTGKFVSSLVFASGITTGGDWTGAVALSDTPGGGSSDRALYRGNDLLYATGDAVPGAPAPLGDGIGPGTFSPNGEHHIVSTDVEPTPGQPRLILLRDGAALELGGALVARDVPVPPSIGGRNGESWFRFFARDVNDRGSYALTGDTNAGAGEDGFLLRDGVMFAREGDTLDGVTLSGRFTSVALNSSGEMAFVCGLLGSEVLFFEDRVVLRSGDAIDWDGDGVPEPTSLLFTAGGFDGSLQLTDDGILYFTAAVSVNGGSSEALFRLDTKRGSVGSPFCASAQPNSTGVPGVLFARGSTRAADDDLTLTAGQLPPGQFGIFVVGRQFGPGVGVPSGGVVCVTGPLGRFTRFDEIRRADANGVFSLEVGLAAIPIGGALESAIAGDTYCFQAWHRDGDSVSPTSNFSGGVSVVFD